MLTTSQRTPSTVSRGSASVHGSTTLIENRRATDREAQCVRITLSALGWSESQSCATSNLSEGGLYVQVPATCGLSVGQRCEVGFDNSADASKPSAVAGEIRYATVVRTDAPTQHSEQHIGAGLRFDQPLFL